MVTKVNNSNSSSFFISSVVCFSFFSPVHSLTLSLLMTVGSLLTVFGLLTGRATTVSTSDILFLLGLGLHLVVLFARTTTTTEVNAILQYLLEV